jgi:hypothetical protein
MKTIHILKDIEEFVFMIILVDYNPNSKLFPFKEIAELPFANQIKIFNGGFAIWEQRLKSVLELH